MADRAQIRIGITGPDGLLGSELFSYLSQNNAFRVHRLEGDICLETVVRQWPIVDIVVNCAAKTNVDECETNWQEAFRVNLIGTKNIVDNYIDNHPWYDELTMTQPHLIQISSEMAFARTNLYGLSKRIADEYIQATLIENRVLDESEISTRDYTILYTTNLFGSLRSKKKSFVKWVVESLRDMPGTLPVSQSMMCRPTWTRDVARAIEKIALEGRFPEKMVVAGPERISKYDFARKTAKEFGFDPERIVAKTGYWGQAPRVDVDLWNIGIDISTATFAHEALKRIREEG